MKQIIIAISSALILACVGTVYADSFSFEGTYAEADLSDFSKWGADTIVGSATMNVSVSGKVLTVVIDNTSPTLLTAIDESGDVAANRPGIVGFGLDILPNGAVLQPGWTLLDKDSNALHLGEWNITAGKTEGITVDFAAWDKDVKGALYNPNGDLNDGAFAALPNYFTLATLTLTFDRNITPDYSREWSPFVRMRHVGPEGEGSLKMVPGDPIPEPATMLLFGSGLAGLAGIARKKKK